METLQKNQNEIQLFENADFGTIRTVVIDGNPWFIAADVCNILGTTNPTMAMDGLEDFEKAKFNLGLRGGATNIISESGFYTLVLRSRKQIAKPFRIWVTSEVLPEIRKNGSYIAPNGNKLDELISEVGNLRIMYAQVNNMENMMCEQMEQVERVLDNMTLSTRQQQRIYKAAKDRINHLLGGAHSPEYKDNAKSYFINLWNDVKSNFVCGSSYKDLNPKDFEKAMEFIQSWEYVE